MHRTQKDGKQTGWGVSLYFELLGRLRKDIKELKLNRKKLKAHQLSMLDFIEGKKAYSQYLLDGEIVQLSRGNAKYGFEHILMNHYAQDANGKLLPREILNIWMLLERGKKVSDFEQKSKGSFAYRLFKTHNGTEIRLTLVNFQDGMIKKVLTYYSDRKQKEKGDLS